MEYEVSSISYDRRNFYAHKHEQLFESSQAKKAKRSFAESDGKKIYLPSNVFKNLEIFVEGQLTVYRSAGEIVGEYSHGSDFSRANACSCLLESYKSTFNEFQYDDVVSFMHPGGYNIHHFFFEVLPVIYMNRYALKGRTVLVPRTQGGGDFFSEFNDLLNLGVNFLRVPVGSIIRGTNIEVFGNFPFRIYPIEVIQKIRNIVWNLPSMKQKGDLFNEVIYIGRGDTERDRRKIKNESEIFKKMRDRDIEFSVIRPGLLPLNETIRKVLNAKIVIGPTGGALFHHIWSKNLETLIELKPKLYESMSESEELSKFLKFSYHESPTHPESNRSWSYDDQVADLGAFKELIRTL